MLSSRAPAPEPASTRVLPRRRHLRGQAQEKCGEGLPGEGFRTRRSGPATGGCWPASRHAPRPCPCGPPNAMERPHGLVVLHRVLRCPGPRPSASSPRADFEFGPTVLCVFTALLPIGPTALWLFTALAPDRTHGLVRSSPRCPRADPRPSASSPRSRCVRTHGLLLFTATLVDRTHGLLRPHRVLDASGPTAFCVRTAFRSRFPDPRPSASAPRWRYPDPPRLSAWRPTPPLLLRVRASLRTTGHFASSFYLGGRWRRLLSRFSKSEILTLQEIRADFRPLRKYRWDEPSGALRLRKRAGCRGRGVKQFVGASQWNPTRVAARCGCPARPGCVTEK